MKQYNGEKAIISLTSWKARIGYVSKTLYSLLKNCPDYHIVLVLSEEEFPRKEDILPTNLKLMIDNDLIEILWVKRNCKAFKKIVFTLDKYRDVPVISADDDCIYLINYADLLYNKWLENKSCCVCFSGRSYENTVFTWGCYTLYPPFCFKENGVKWVDEFAIELLEDDRYYAVLKGKMGIPTSFVEGHKMKDIVHFEQYDKPLRNLYLKHDTNYVYNKLKSHIKI